MSDRATWSNGHKLLKNTEVSLRVKELRQKAQDIVVVDEARTLAELAGIVFNDPCALR